MRKQIFSLLAAAMVFPIAAQMRSNSSSLTQAGPHRLLSERLSV